MRAITDDEIRRLRESLEELPPNLLRKAIVKMRASKLLAILSEIATVRGDSQRFKQFISEPLDVEDAWLEDE